MPLKVVQLELKRQALRLDLKTMVYKMEKQKVVDKYLLSLVKKAEQIQSPLKQSVILEPKQAVAQVSKPTFPFGSFLTILSNIQILQKIH